MDELKPCPFCGGSVEISDCTANTARRIVRGTFVCGDCGARITLKTDFLQNPISTLEETWNRRVEDGKKLP